MSTNVQIYTETVPTIEHGHLVLDENTHLTLPIGARAAAAWCEDFAALLLEHADRERIRDRQERADLAAARRDVEEARAQRSSGT